MISSHCLLYVVDLFSVLVMTHRCNITLILSEPLAVSVCRLFRVNTKHSNLSLVQISVIKYLVGNVVEQNFEVIVFGCRNLQLACFSRLWGDAVDAVTF